MQVFGNERIVQQGEEWNLDILVSQSNADYVPFIVSSERRQGSRVPMWAITVASTKYEKNERYVATWWLDLLSGTGEEPLPLFYQTVPQDLGERSTHLMALPSGDAPMEMLYRYTIVGKPEEVHYVYFDEIDGEVVRHDDYECRIRMQFKSSETANWGSQNYMYQITLVDTVSMPKCIELAKEHYPNLQWPKWVTEEEWLASGTELTWENYKEMWLIDNQKELYEFIKNRIPDWFQPDIDADAKAGYIDNPQVILPPTKLQVNNNLRRII